MPAVVTALAVTGCITHRIDWDSRVGTYTFDQAVAEFGPPDKQAKLSNGQLVAEWISRYYHGGTAMVGAGFYGNPGEVGVVQSAPTYDESELRLTFTTNNVLSAWSKD